MSAAFSIENGDTLRIVYEGRVDRDSILNMTSHLYFNLSGEASTQDHRLEVAADAYLPVDAALIPTGEIRPVEGTPFDFRKAKRLADGPDMLDHNFCLEPARHAEPRPIARLSSEAGGVSLTLSSTECGLQVYDGAKFDGTIEGLDDTPIQPHGGIALEPQAWPDAPNHPDFPSTRIGAGETYRHTILYRFERI
jgi:aldose 1-epimerase